MLGRRSIASQGSSLAALLFKRMLKAWLLAMRLQVILSPDEESR